MPPRTAAIAAPLPPAAFHFLLADLHRRAPAVSAASLPIGHAASLLSKPSGLASTLRGPM